MHLTNCRRCVAGLGAAAVEEASHEAIVGYFLAVRRGARVRDPEAFVVGALRRQATLQRRRQRRSRTSPIESAHGVAAEATEVDTAEIERVLATMPSQRQAWVRDLMLDLSDGELAQARGVSTEAIRQRRRRALRQLQDVFLVGHHEGTPAT